MVDIEDFVSFCKRRGFVYQNSDIYGGFSGFYDYGPVGVEIVRNIKNEWWKSVVSKHDNVVGLDGSIISHPKVWKASGHIDEFIDYIVECGKCESRFRADHLVEDKTGKNAEDLDAKNLEKEIKNNKICCPNCKNKFDKVEEFNLMFKTQVGPGNGETSYLRPETAQSIFINFKNILDTTRLKLPFGIAQIGKAFRNEISPRNFLFRMREFEQMEMEFFTNPKEKGNCDLFDDFKKLKVNFLSEKAQNKDNNAKELSIEKLLKEKTIETKWHAYWIAYRYNWFLDLGIKSENLRLREHKKDELSHYSNSTFDIEYNYPFGWKELEGIADRTDFDLKQHQKESNSKLNYFEEKSKKRITPHVAAEPSVGVDRVFLAFILDAYEEEEVKGRKRVVLKLNPKITPYKIAVFPLVKKDGLPKKAKEIYKKLKNCFSAFYDEKGSIGKRYRRMDEIGTFYCITVDHQTLEDNTVTIRDRDSMKQERIDIEKLMDHVYKNLYS